MFAMRCSNKEPAADPAMDTQANINTRIAMPNRGGALFFMACSMIVVFFTVVAVYNLIHIAALTALEVGGSILWLLLVMLLSIRPLVEAGGPRQLMVSIAGIFSRRAFVELQRGKGDPPVLRYGFEWLHKGFWYDAIECTRIGMVSWSSGQASDMSGRDCDDWTVAVWYVTDGNATAATWDRENLPDKRIRIVTPSLPKQDADAIGRSVVALLQDAGVEMTPTSDVGTSRCEFTVKTASV
jgi:hypothetical protein